MKRKIARCCRSWMWVFFFFVFLFLNTLLQSNREECAILFCKCDSVIKNQFHNKYLFFPQRSDRRAGSANQNILSQPGIAEREVVLRMRIWRSGDLGICGSADLQIVRSGIASRESGIEKIGGTNEKCGSPTVSDWCSSPLSLSHLARGQVPDIDRKPRISNPRIRVSGIGGIEYRQSPRVPLRTNA